ncbi:PerC family transcriptional regulator [Lonsdalea quercina]|uniref:PerC family transcriptional regulator n=1 Tax=Lonsdalea quercina TaxID=71657 RepID=UPI00056037FA|nr:PerC family transcriptional regulator [Lonsdalea quercina]
MLIDDIALAESLEDRGLWRRAAQQWLMVLDQTDISGNRELIVLRRQCCLRLAQGIRNQYSGVREMTVSGGVLHG